MFSLAAPERLANWLDNKIYKGTPHQDVWSLGCVLSMVVSWVACGHRGVLEYETLRRNAIKKLCKENASKAGIFQTTDDPISRKAAIDAYFHDGQNVLPVVHEYHRYLEEDYISRSDTTTPMVIRLIEKYMLVAPERRMPANFIWERWCREKDNQSMEGEDNEDQAILDTIQEKSDRRIDSIHSKPLDTDTEATTTKSNEPKDFVEDIPSLKDSLPVDSLPSSGLLQANVSVCGGEIQNDSDSCFTRQDLAYGSGENTQHDTYSKQSPKLPSSEASSVSAVGSSTHVKHMLWSGPQNWRSENEVLEHGEAHGSPKETITFSEQEMDNELRGLEVSSLTSNHTDIGVGETEPQLSSKLEPLLPPEEESHIPEMISLHRSLSMQAQVRKESRNSSMTEDIVNWAKLELERMLGLRISFWPLEEPREPCLAGYQRYFYDCVRKASVMTVFAESYDVGLCTDMISHNL